MTHNIFSAYSINFKVYAVVSHNLNSRTMGQFFSFHSSTHLFSFREWFFVQPKCFILCQIYFHHMSSKLHKTQKRQMGKYKKIKKKKEEANGLGLNFSITLWKDSLSPTLFIPDSFPIPSFLFMKLIHIQVPYGNLSLKRLRFFGRL